MKAYMTRGVAWFLALVLFLTGIGIEHLQVLAQSNQQFDYNNAVYNFSEDSHLHKGTSASISDKKLVMNIGSAWGAARARLPFEFVAGTDYSISFDVSVEHASAPKVWVVLASNGDTNSGVDNSDAGAAKRLSTQLNAGTQITTDTGYKYTFDFDSNATTDGLIGQGYKYFGIFVQSGTAGKVYIDNVNACIKGTTIYDFSDSSDLQKGASASISDEKLALNIGNAWGAARARVPYEFVAGTDYSISFDVDVEQTSAPKVWVILASNGDTNAGVDHNTETKILSKQLNAGTQIATETGYKYTFDFTSNSTTDGLIGQGYKYLGFFVQSGTTGKVYIDDISVYKWTKEDAPSIPVVQSFTENSITLVPTDGYEYRIGDNGEWQTLNVFTNLTVGQEYRFYQRVAATDKTKASDASPVLVYTLQKEDTRVYTFSDSTDLQKGVNTAVSNGKLVMNIASAWGAARARLPYNFEKETNYSVSFDVDVAITSAPKVWVILASNSDTNAGVDNNTETKILSKQLNAGTQVVAGTGYKYTFDFNSSATTDGLIDQGYQYFGIFVQSGTAGEVYIDNVEIKKNDGGQDDSGTDKVWPVVFENFNDSKYVIRKGNAALTHDTSDGNLDVSTTQGWVMTYLLLPFKPENGTTYQVGIEYQGRMNDVKAGVYKANADVNDFYNSANKTSSCNFENSSSYGVKQIQIQIGTNWVNDVNKYLGFEFKSNGTNAYSIKSITISKVEGKVSFVTGLDGFEVSSIQGAIGENVALPNPTHPDYAFEGWYLDPEFTNKCTELAFSKDEQILYAKWTEVVERIFDFSNASEYKVYSGSVSNDVLTLSNSAATSNNYKQTSVVLPYALKNDCGYQVEIKYKTNLDKFNLKIGNFKNTADWDMIQGRTDFVGVSNKTSSDYAKQTFKFATTNEITSANNQLGIFVQVGGSDEFIIDQVKVTKLEGKVRFETNLDDFEVETEYGVVGENVMLPQPKHPDFLLEGWYTDAELKNRCVELKFAKEVQVLYAKWKENPINVFDFSNANDYKVYNGSVSNGVLTLSNAEGTAKNYKQTSVVLPYKLQNDCGYQVEIKYKTNLDKFNLKIGNFKDTANWDMIQGRTDFVSVSDKTSNSYTVQSFTFATDDKITTANNQLGIMVQVGGDEKFVIDEVKVTKLGCKVRFETNIDGFEVDAVYGIVDKKVSLPTPKHPDFELEGWYTDAELKNRCVELKFKKEVQVLYAKWVENPVNVFDFSDASDYKVFSGVVSNGVAKLSNSAGTEKDYKQTSILFPYELENGCGYRVEIKYKTNLAKFDMKLSNFKSSSGWDMIQGRTEFAGVVNKPSSGYTIATCTFSTTNQITKDNKYLGILVRVGGADSVYIDEVKITKLKGKISFNTNTTESLVDPVYGTKGDTITLPKPPRRKTYIFQGWYYDAQLTQAVGDKYSFKSSDVNITLYAKWEYGTTNVFDFSEPSEYKVYNGNIENGVLKLSNAAGKKTDYKQTSVVFPYELENNKTYQVTIRYKTNLKNYSFVVGNFKNVSTWDMIQDRTNLFKMDNIQNDKWTEKTFIFSTKNEMTNINKYFGILVSVGGADAFYIDEVSIKCFDVVVNFEAYYDATKIDFAPMGGAQGETITLHTEAVRPFVVQEWYYDKALTKPVGKKLTLGSKDITLYGKISLQKKVIIDFEKEDMAGVTGTQYIERIVDPKDPKNHIVRARWDQESYKSNYVAVNYMLLPNRQYKISMKYRIDKPALIQFLVKSGNGETVWNAAGEGLGTNLLTAMIYGKIQNKDWETVELTFTTDMSVDDVYHYLFLHLREPGVGANFDFDDIIIEDMGEFKPSDFVTKIDSYEWPSVTDDIDKYSFGKAFLANNPKQLLDKIMSNKVAALTLGISTVLLLAIGGTVLWKTKRKKKEE